MKINKIAFLGFFLTLSFIIILGVSFKIMNAHAEKLNTEWLTPSNEKQEFMTIYTNLSMYHVDIDNLVIQEENWDGQIKFNSYRELADSLETITANDVNISMALPQDCWVNSQTFLGFTTLEVVTWEYDHRIIIGTVEYTENMGWTYYPNCVELF